MLRLARWTTTHRKYVLLGWVALLIVVNVFAQSAGTTYSNNFTLPNSDAQRAANLLQSSFPAPGRRPRHDRLQGQLGNGARPAGQGAHELAVRARRHASARRFGDQPVCGRRRGKGDLGQRPDRVRDRRVRRESEPAAEERARTCACRRRAPRPSRGCRSSSAARRSSRPSRQASACRPRSACSLRSSSCC